MHSVDFEADPIGYTNEVLKNYTAKACENSCRIDINWLDSIAMPIIFFEHSTLTSQGTTWSIFFSRFKATVCTYVKSG